MWRVESPAQRYLRRVPMRTSRALACLLGGYAVIGVLVAWMLTSGNPSDSAIRSLAPIGMFVAVLVGVGALGAVVFGGRRYVLAALGTLGIAVGVAVTAAGSLVSSLM